MKKKPIRDMAKRFKIVLYHLNKICEDWGRCRGVSADDVSALRRVEAQVTHIFKERKFEPFDGELFISEEEFDNEPQVTAILEEENKQLKARVATLEAMVDGIRNCCR